MSRSPLRTLVPLLTVFTVAFGLSGCDRAEAPTSPTDVAEETSANHHETVTTAPGTLGELAGVRAATAPYNNVRRAVSDGYVQFSLFVPNMGFHYLHESVINADATSALDRELDRSDPEILVYVDDAPRSQQRRLVAVEYAIPKEEDHPPAEAVNLFSGADAHDWHVHPSVHELPLPDTWTIHGECHYQGGIGVFLAENPSGDFVLWTPPTGAFGSWSGTVAPDQCPTALAGDPLPPLLIAHGKWWTLHAWVWHDNPEGVFHATNPRVGS
ncbi:MAG: hypothetical protein R3223_01850 [Longimicrobiales bacterium]|nr:hypothetical protein [Longimicrobiales bacterium]